MAAERRPTLQWLWNIPKSPSAAIAEKKIIDEINIAIRLYNKLTGDSPVRGVHSITRIPAATPEPAKVQIWFSASRPHIRRLALRDPRFSKLGPLPRNQYKK
jgi:hypothetical protein